MLTDIQSVVCPQIRAALFFQLPRLETRQDMLKTSNIKGDRHTSLSEIFSGLKKCSSRSDHCDVLYACIMVADSRDKVASFF